jgi:uncharacterized protein YecT (DUF1311 family)
MFARISGRKIALALALSIPFACSRLGVCAEEDAILLDIRSADLELNESYQALLHALPISGREQLRVAERAWLAFIEKNNEAVTEVARARPAPTAFVLELRLAEIRQRCEELRAILGEQPASLATVYFSGDPDSELNKVYQRCMRTLSQGDEQRLREAQRAWINFRDKHTATNSGKTRSAVARLASSLPTIHRVTSLEAIYLEALMGSSLEEANEVAEDKNRDSDNYSIPDPFATAR